jgi:hypothetical protein
MRRGPGLEGAFEREVARRLPRSTPEEGKDFD